MNFRKAFFSTRMLCLHVDRSALCGNRESKGGKYFYWRLRIRLSLLFDLQPFFLEDLFFFFLHVQYNTVIYVMIYLNGLLDGRLKAPSPLPADRYLRFSSTFRKMGILP